MLNLFRKSRFSAVGGLLLTMIGLSSMTGPALADGSSLTVWVPDYLGEHVNVLVGAGATTPIQLDLSPENCTPNSVAVNGSQLYVACSTENGQGPNGNGDEILIFNATTIRNAPKGLLTLSPVRTIQSVNFQQLIALAFDASNNLWVSSYNNNTIFSISAGTLNTATPAITASLVESPSAPAGLAFDTDGSLWVAGQYEGGILINFPQNQLQAGVNANPSYYVGADRAPGVAFNNPEGIAIFNINGVKTLWVSNNGGNAPGMNIVPFTLGTPPQNGAPGTLTAGTAVTGTNPALQCPGGMFATPAHLWLNDESFGVTNGTTCGATDPKTPAGGLLSFTQQQLTGNTIGSSQYTLKVTSRPGFGGIYVENDAVTAVAVPTISPATGTFSTPTTVTISDATAGASIYITTDGSTPTTSSAKYSGPLSISRTLTLKAIASLNGSSSTAATASYTYTAAAAHWATGYYPAYETGNMPISAIPFASMTHVIHFSLVPAHTPDDTFTAEQGKPGTLTDPYGLLAESPAFVAAAHAAGAKALLGIGGDNFGADAGVGFEQGTAAANLATLVQNIVTTMKSNNYDGVDINWEGIVGSDGSMPDATLFQNFIKALRTALDNAAPPTHYLLTFPSDTSSNYNVYAKYADLLLPVVSALDQINLESYLMSGNYPGWMTWHNSPLYNTSCNFAVFLPTQVKLPSIDTMVQDFIGEGIPKSKLGIGIQLIGVDWPGGVITTTTNGTTTPTGNGATAPCQSWDYSTQAADGTDTGAPGYPSYDYNLPNINAADIFRTYLTNPAYVQNFDNNAMVPYLSNNQPGSNKDEFISYENAQSIQAKGQYLTTEGLGGMIIFEISQDYMQEQPAGDAQHPLLTAVRKDVLNRP